MVIEGIEVIDHDDSLWVLNKPSGLLSAPGRGPEKQDSVMSRVLRHDPAALQVHRLDQATSGLLLMARTPKVQRQLQAAFAARDTLKIYLALVHSPHKVKDVWQLIDVPIALHWPDRPRHHVGTGGKPSQTWWQVLAHDPDTQRSLVALRPITGRSHQIRVHLSWLGLPILGDTLYAPMAIAELVPRLCLHAWQLGLKHPISSAPVLWQSPILPILLSGFCQQTVAQRLHNLDIPPPKGDLYA
ncbi:MAG: RluA family pseudouridine synthase [Alphaproteobacteria bacterium]|nr:RluA family pseudouridine synthase [Alphaproteobacteria bacterium]